MQNVKVFYEDFGYPDIDDQINSYLTEHQDYKIYSISMATRHANGEDKIVAMVVFEIDK